MGVDGVGVDVALLGALGMDIPLRPLVVGAALGLGVGSRDRLGTGLGIVVLG